MSTKLLEDLYIIHRTLECVWFLRSVMKQDKKKEFDVHVENHMEIIYEEVLNLITKSLELQPEDMDEEKIKNITVLVEKCRIQRKK